MCTKKYIIYLLNTKSRFEMKRDFVFKDLDD